jgi:N-acetylneuraminic acid mutarotase
MRKCLLPVVAALLMASSSLASAKGLATLSAPSGERLQIPPPAIPDAVLYDQMDNDTGNAITSQDFETGNDALDSQLADDFVVPSPGWTITSVDVAGQSSGPAASYHVFFYANAGGLPGALVESRLNQTFTGSSSVSITLSPAVSLPPGAYWLAVQARQDLVPNGQWWWEERSVASGMPGVWENPGDGFGTGCTTWTVKATCFGGTSAGPDQMFRLNGSVNGANWTNAASLPIDVYGASATAANGKLYAGGGYSFSGGADVNNFQVWDPDTDSWTPLAPVPDTSATMAAMVYGHNGKIYMIGGENVASGTVVATTRIYDIASNTWSTGAAMPDFRSFAGYGYYDGGIFIAGGYSTGFVDSGHNTTWRYDIAADSWNASLATMPVTLGGFGSGVIDDVLYVAGGRDVGGQYPGVYAYNIDSDSWSTVTAMPGPNNVPGAAIFSGQLWIYGGGNPFSSPEAAALPDAPDTANTCWAYEPQTAVWSNCPSLLQARSFDAGAAVRNVPVAVGGYNGSSTTASVEINATSPGIQPDGSGHRLVVSGETNGFVPNNFTRVESLNLVEYTYASSRPATHDFALFDTHDPWSFTVLKDAIAHAGHTYTEFGPANLAGFPFSDYRVVILNWDDTNLADFDSAYEAAIPALEDYMRAGGVVWVQAATQANIGDFISLPFGGQLNQEFHGQNFIVDQASPTVTGMSNPVHGTSASHTAASGIPAAAHAIKLTEDAFGAPTLYELSAIIFVDGFESGDTSRWSATVP